MQPLGEVLERLHTVWERLGSAQGTMRFAYQPKRTRLAWERWQHASPAGSIQPISTPRMRAEQAAREAGPEGALELFSEQYYRFWMAKPWRWRIEQFAAVPDASAQPEQVHVIDGDLWWRWSAGAAVSTNAQAAPTERTGRPGVDRGLLVMLDPAPLLGTLRMRVAESAEAIGRLGDVVIGAARDPQPDPGLWPGADEYRLLVEREHGILLRAEALRDGAPFAETAFTALILDQEPPAERFALQR